MNMLPLTYPPWSPRYLVTSPTPSHISGLAVWNRDEVVSSGLLSPTPFLRGLAVFFLVLTPGAGGYDV